MRQKSARVYRQPPGGRRIASAMPQPLESTLLLTRELATGPWFIICSGFHKNLICSTVRWLIFAGKQFDIGPKTQKLVLANIAICTTIDSVYKKYSQSVLYTEIANIVTFKGLGYCKSGWSWYCIWRKRMNSAGYYTYIVKADIKSWSSPHLKLWVLRDEDRPCSLN